MPPWPRQLPDRVTPSTPPSLCRGDEVPAAEPEAEGEAVAGVVLAFAVWREEEVAVDGPTLDKSLLERTLGDAELNIDMAPPGAKAMASSSAGERGGGGDEDAARDEDEDEDEDADEVEQPDEEERRRRRRRRRRRWP